MTDTAIGVIGFEDGRGAIPQEYRWPLEIERDREVNPPQSFQKEPVLLTS